MTVWVYIGSGIYPPGQEFVRILPVYTDECPASDAVSCNVRLLKRMRKIQIDQR